MSGSVSRTVRAAALSLVVVAAGCSSSQSKDRLPVFRTTGEIHVGGQPAEGVTVVLIPAEGSEAAGKKLSPSAVTEVDGTYQISTYDQGDGAPEGEYRITLKRYVDPSSGKNGPPEGFMPEVDRWNGKYSKPDKSPWKASITQGDNVLDTIDVDERR
jgi:hypothetical protein